MSHKWQHGVFSCLAAVVGMVLAGGTTGAGAQEEGADVQLNWVAGMGRGGATIARLSDRTTAEPAKATFTRLTAVVFPPGRREVVFVGEAVEGEAPLEPQELLDVLILALRALRRGEAPGVDMRPDATKLDGEGLVPEGAPMRVTYFGGIENTVLGLAAFGSDRLLKCLDFDKDNETRELFGCKVEGYRSGLELAAGMDGGVGSRWHRIWIEHSRSAVRRSPDGRTFIPEAELRVEPRAQDLVGGDWKDAKRPASPSARAFTDHLTRNYAAYARAYPVLRRLWEFAKLVSVAEALLPPEPGKADLARPALDWAWVLSEYQPQRVPTTASTPAARATREIKDGAGKPIGTLRMSGGVTLRPKNAYHDGDRLAEAIGAAALDALRREPARGNWPVAAQGRALQAAGCPMLSVETVRLWQTDLTVGGLEAVREFPLRDARPAIGGGWALRVPSLTVSRETVKLDSGDVVPREIRFRFGSRQEVFLDQHWKFTPPGQITVRNYRNLEGTAGLLCYKNFWYYVEGKLESLWAGGSPLGRGLRPGERVVTFPAGAPHRPTQHVTAEGVVKYGYEGERLKEMSDGRGNSIALDYDAAGLLAGLRGSNGTRVEYRRDPKGRLRAAVNSRGQAMSIQASSDGVPEAVQFDSPEAPTGGTAEFGVARLPQRPTKADAFVHVSHAPAGAGRDYDIVAAGREVKGDGKVDLHVQAVLDGEDAGGRHAAALRDLFLLSKLPAGAQQPVVLLGPVGIREDLATALRKVAPGLFIVTASDPERASRSLAAAPAREGPARVVVSDQGIPGAVAEELRATATPADSRANTVVLTGHNGEDYLRRFDELGREGQFRGKHLVLPTCGTRRTPGMVERALGDYGAASVTYFGELLDARRLPGIVKAIQQLLEAPKNRVKSLLEVLEQIKQRLKLEALPPAREQVGMDGRAQPPPLASCSHKRPACGTAALGPCSASETLAATSTEQAA